MVCVLQILKAAFNVKKIIKELVVQQKVGLKVCFA